MIKSTFMKFVNRLGNFCMYIVYGIPKRFFFILGLKSIPTLSKKKIFHLFMFLSYHKIDPNAVIFQDIFKNFYESPIIKIKKSVSNIPSLWSLATETSFMKIFVTANA